MKVKSSNTKKILKFLVTGTGIAILSLANPLLPTQLFKAYIKNRKFRKNLFLKDLRRLQQRHLIEYEAINNDKIKLTIKRRGKEIVLTCAIDDMVIDKPKSWDRVWRLIIFDIPNTKKKARTALREKLNNLGFYKLHKSVYIIPWPCENEIDFIGKIFNIRKYILLLELNNFEGAEKLKNYFKLV